MNAHNGRMRVNISHHQGHQTFNSLALRGGFFTARAGRRQVSFKSKDAKSAPASGEVSLGYLDNAFESHTSILRRSTESGRDARHTRSMRLRRDLAFGNLGKAFHWSASRHQRAFR